MAIIAKQIFYAEADYLLVDFTAGFKFGRKTITLLSLSVLSGINCFRCDMDSALNGADYQFNPEGFSQWLDAHDKKVLRLLKENQCSRIKNHADRDQIGIYHLKMRTVIKGGAVILRESLGTWNRCGD